MIITLSETLLLAISSDSAGEEEKFQLQDTEVEMEEESSSSLCFLRDTSVINVLWGVITSTKVQKTGLHKVPTGLSIAHYYVR